MFLLLLHLPNGFNTLLDNIILLEIRISQTLSLSMPLSTISHTVRTLSWGTTHSPEIFLDVRTANLMRRRGSKWTSNSMMNVITHNKMAIIARPKMGEIWSSLNELFRREWFVSSSLVITHPHEWRENKETIYCIFRFVFFRQSWRLYFFCVCSRPWTKRYELVKHPYVIGSYRCKSGFAVSYRFRAV